METLLGRVCIFAMVSLLDKLCLENECLSFLVEKRGGTLLKIYVLPTFRQIGGEQGAFLGFVASHLPSPQNNCYAQVAYLGITYPITFLSTLLSKGQYLTT